jgi:hypothetical protein
MKIIPKAKKALPREMRISSEAIYWHLLKAPSHTLLQKVGG